MLVYAMSAPNDPRSVSGSESSLHTHFAGFSLRKVGNMTQFYLVARSLHRAIVASSREGDLVFDPFCGSGTTGVASKELGRFFVGAEKEGAYAELAGRRIGAAVRGGVLQEIEEAGPGV